LAIETGWLRCYQQQINILLETKELRLL
jgi:hypothetical protein